MLTHSCRLASLLLTVAAYASVCLAEPAARPDVPMPALQEEIWVLPLPLPSIAYVVRPAGKGPFPLVIMNHGVAMDPRDRWHCLSSKWPTDIAQCSPHVCLVPLAEKVSTACRERSLNRSHSGSSSLLIQERLVAAVHAHSGYGSLSLRPDPARVEAA
jgi:hypothetical protein